MCRGIYYWKGGHLFEEIRSPNTANKLPSRNIHTFAQLDQGNVIIIRPLTEVFMLENAWSVDNIALVNGTLILQPNADGPLTGMCTKTIENREKTKDCTARQCSPLRRKFMECYIIKPAQSLLMKHLVISQRYNAPDFSAFNWSPRGNLVSIGQHFVITRVVHLPKRTETS